MEKGDLVVVIEHNLDVITSASTSWISGPGAGIPLGRSWRSDAGENGGGGEELYQAVFEGDAEGYTSLKYPLSQSATSILNLRGSHF